MNDLLWPSYDGPDDLAAIEAVPLAERGLPATTYDALRRAAELWPDRTALSVLPGAARWRDYREVTFGELLARVHRVANLLHDRGVRRGDAVGLLAPNGLELVVATLAAQVAGIAAPVNAGLRADHVAELLARSGARVVLVGGDAGLVEGAAVDAVIELADLDRLAAGQPDDRFVGRPPAATDLAALFHTGGTTGTPKLAAHTHANEVADAWMIAANTMLDDDAVVFAALPLFHVNALVVTLLAPLLRGQQVVWAGPLGYRDVDLYGRFWRIVEHFGIAAMSAVPTVYQVLAEVPVDADISSLRAAMVGASALPPAVREAFEWSTTVPLLEGYGLTEATCASVRSFVDHPRPGSVGQRMPYQQVKVVRIDDDGTWHDLPTGATGVLAIAGPTVFPGYVVGHDARGPRLDGLGKLVDGWLDTGDLARVDEDGFVYLTGRAKDLIIRGGHNIDPAVVEDALLDHPEVTGAAAVGRPDLHAGEVPVGYVTLVPGATTTGDDLRTWAAERVPERAAAPKEVTVVDALPVTAVGKPFKLALRADAARAVLAAALDGVTGVLEVRAEVEDGAVVATVSAAPGVDEAAVKEALGGYAVAWLLEVVR